MTFQPTTSSFPAAPDFPPSGEWTPIFPGGASSYDEYMDGFPGKDPVREACLDAEHERRKRLRSREVSDEKWARLMGIRARIEGRPELLSIPETRPVGPGTGPTQERVDARERKRKRKQDLRDKCARAKARFATEEQRTI